MTDSHSLFSSYEELVQNHARQFDPQIAQLQQLVTTRMQELRAAEQTLLDAQAIELQNIFNALATKEPCKNNLNNFYIEALSSKHSKINLYNLFLHES
ncbi:hypothetical protein H6G64_34380 [Calothrix sp. FACHB-156]|nr:hypothetical protein [Nostoc linckia FACHB-104]MBD2342021.1 hypothetical protein [Calothrix sp. FACHB-156]